MRTLFLALAIFLPILNAAGAAPLPAAPQPSPGLSPREVVQLQLDALKKVDQPVKDAGFATVFRFASPRNQAQTGPLPRFSKMIREGFGEMLNHKSARLETTLQQQDEALQPVVLTSLAGRTFRYVFLLRLQDSEDCKACWLTDGVIPQDESTSSQEL